MSARRIALVLGVALGLLGVDRPRGLGDVVAVRHWSYPDYTRVVVELTRGVQPTVKRLPPDQSADRPERLYLDLEQVWVGRRFAEGIAVGDGLLRSVRLGQNTLTTSRLVIDVEHYERHRLITLEHPHRVVVDVYGPREDGEQLSWPPRDGSGPPSGRLPPELRQVRTVVIDPGHGGRDPGAIGIGGLREKDVNLRLARALSPRLRDEGFRVVLTREDDRYVDLEERTAIAQAARGDLFLSLHANAARRRSVRGVETYYLDENHERHSLRVAARENGVAEDQLDALQRTLARLRVSEVSPHSRRLASLVQDHIVRGLPSRYGTVPDLGVKKGPFHVLFLSDMPAVLLEAGFLTNRTDAQRLGDEAYVAALAEQIAVAFQSYRDRLPSVALGSAR